MRYIKPRNIKGKLKAPPSKSITARAIIAASLAKGKSRINNPLFCDDTNAVINCARDLGAKIEVMNESIEIIGGLNPIAKNINCGESALCVRIFAPILALLDKEIIIDGVGTLLDRSMSDFSEPFKRLNVEYSSNNGNLPISVKGKLEGGEISIKASKSSQYLSGFLYALSLAKNDSIIYVKNLASKPYIDLTLDILEKFNIKIINDNYNTFKIKGSQEYNARDFEIEGDWSSAAFLMVGAAISGEIELSGLNLNSKQADRRILGALEECGAKIIKAENLIISKSELKPFIFDANDCPDLFPPLTALAANCDGVSIIKGINRLMNKETNRALTLQKAFEAIGVEISFADDAMIIKGGEIRGGEIDSFGDHRIAMAGAIAALNSKNGVHIKNSECVSKSYNEFFNDLVELIKNK